VNGARRSLQGDPISPCFWLQIGEVASSGGSLVQRNASLRSESRHRHERGALPGGQPVLAVACQETEGFRLGRFLRPLIAQRSCEV
jgi:hypothetical protein